jgi:hypothetical protein
MPSAREPAPGSGPARTGDVVVGLDLSMFYIIPKYTILSQNA